MFSNSKFSSIDEFFDSLSEIDIGTGLLRLGAVAYLEPCRTSIMDQFCENNYRLNPLTIFAEKLHGRCLTGFFGGCLEQRFTYNILLFGNLYGLYMSFSKPKVTFKAVADVSKKFYTNCHLGFIWFTLCHSVIGNWHLRIVEVD